MSNTTTVQNLFSTTITDFFVQTVSSHLSEWLKTNKNCEVSQEELCEAFNVKFTSKTAGLPQSANVGTQMPSLPGYFSGTGSAAPKKGGGRRKKKVEPDPLGRTCKYLFQRGDNVGKECGEPVCNDGSPGSDTYCKTCIKKKTVQKKIQSGETVSSKVQPPVMPGGMVEVEDNNNSNESGGSVNAVPIEGHPGMFKDIDDGFILQQREDNSVVALQIEVDGVQRPLTREEKLVAQRKGIDVLDSPTPDSAVNVGPPQSVPQVAPQSVPQVPQVGQGIPQVPQVPQVSIH